MQRQGNSNIQAGIRDTELRDANTRAGIKDRKPGNSILQVGIEDTKPGIYEMSWENSNPLESAFDLPGEIRPPPVLTPGIAVKLTWFLAVTSNIAVQGPFGSPFTDWSGQLKWEGTH